MTQYNDIEYNYNASGLRVAKFKAGKFTNYYYQGSTLLGEDLPDGSKLRYMYDSNEIVGVRHHRTDGTIIEFFILGYYIAPSIVQVFRFSHSIAVHDHRNFMGLSVGKLDPCSEVLSKKNSLLFLDTFTDYYQTIENTKFNADYQFVLLYSGVERKLVNSKYNTRVAECLRATERLNVVQNESKTLRERN